MGLLKSVWNIINLWESNVFGGFLPISKDSWLELLVVSIKKFCVVKCLLVLEEFRYWDLKEK